MRMLSLRPFRFFRTPKLIAPARNFQVRSLTRHSFNTPKYLKISLPLSLFALTYAFSTFSAKADEQPSASIPSAKILKRDEGQQKDQDTIEEYQKIFQDVEQKLQQGLQNISEYLIFLEILFNTEEARRKVKENPKLKQNIRKRQNLEERYQKLVKLLEERSNLSDQLENQTLSPQKEQDMMEKFMEYTSRVSLHLNQVLQDSQKIIEQLIDGQIYDESILETKINSEIERMQKEEESNDSK